MNVIDIFQGVVLGMGHLADLLFQGHSGEQLSHFPIVGREWSRTSRIPHCSSRPDTQSFNDRWREHSGAGSQGGGLDELSAINLLRHKFFNSLFSGPWSPLKKTWGKRAKGEERPR